MKRLLDRILLEWASADDAKPLLLRGARQVGKTYSVRQLGKRFRHFVEINFEETPEVGRFFDGPLTIAPLVSKLSAFAGKPIHPGESLLFLDEVQKVPRVLASLRFFREQMPNLRVVAAGSLLEFAMEEVPSFAVGRVTSRFLYPMVFPEFLMALGDDALLDLVKKADFDHPVDPVFHARLLERYRAYLLVGGMPEAVAAYAKTGDFLAASSILDDLLRDFRDDFAKYAKRVPLQRLDETFRSVAAQTGNRFICATVSPDTKSTAILSALFLLEKAGLVHRAVQTAASGIPLGAQSDDRRFKALLLDTGLCQRLLGLDLGGELLSGDAELVNKGQLAELAAGLSLVAAQNPALRPQLHYWERASRGANAEVDYVVQIGTRIIPVEVKAGTRGAMQSLRLFLAEKHIPFGVRLSLENFGRLPDVRILPLYASHRLASLVGV
jgi:predicted AAA+ superfamily ATPase